MKTHFQVEVRYGVKLFVKKKPTRKWVLEVSLPGETSSYLAWTQCQSRIPSKDLRLHLIRVLRALRLSPYFLALGRLALFDIGLGLTQP